MQTTCDSSRPCICLFLIAASTSPFTCIRCGPARLPRGCLLLFVGMQDCGAHIYPSLVLRRVEGTSSSRDCESQLLIFIYYFRFWSRCMSKAGVTFRVQYLCGTRRNEWLLYPCSMLGLGFCGTHATSVTTTSPFVSRWHGNVRSTGAVRSCAPSRLPSGLILDISLFSFFWLTGLPQLHSATPQC